MPAISKFIRRPPVREGAIRRWDVQKGLNTKIHLAVDEQGMPIRVFITSGTTAGCAKAESLIVDLDAHYLQAYKGYDSDAIVNQALAQDIVPVIPPRKNRKAPRDYDKALYQYRHLVENAFLHLKRWCGIATRYAKNAASFLAAVQIRCIALWAAIL